MCSNLTWFQWGIFSSKTPFISADVTYDDDFGYGAEMAAWLDPDDVTDEVISFEKKKRKSVDIKSFFKNQATKNDDSILQPEPAISSSVPSAPDSPLHPDSFDDECLDFGVIFVFFLKKISQFPMNDPLVESDSVILWKWLHVFNIVVIVSFWTSFSS